MGVFEDAFRRLNAAGKNNEAQLVRQIAELTTDKGGRRTGTANGPGKGGVR